MNGYAKRCSRRARRAKPKGRKPETDPTVQRLVVNMERWRWMPPELGSYYVWDNIPAFTVRVISDGKSVYAEKAVVGQFKYATPIFSAEMKSIVFNPEWTVPETIIREDLGPSLRQGEIIRARYVGAKLAWAQGQLSGAPRRS